MSPSTVVVLAQTQTSNFVVFLKFLIYMLYFNFARNFIKIIHNSESSTKNLIIYSERQGVALYSFVLPSKKSLKTKRKNLKTSTIELKFQLKNSEKKYIHKTDNSISNKSLKYNACNGESLDNVVVTC